MATIYDALFLQALDLSPGEQIYIPCEDKQEQKKTEKVIKEAMVNAPVDVQLKLRVVRTFKDKKLWVVIARKNPLHEEFFTKVRTASGDWAVKRTNLGTDATRLRMLEAMIEDGLTEEEIKEHLGEISEIERKLFFPTIKEEEDSNGC